MLEHSSLLLGPWVRPKPAQPEKKRTILDAETRQYLGHAILYQHNQEGLLSWLRGERLKIYETEDTSLLTTLSRSWGLSRTWQVADADDRRVGLIYRTELWNARGEPLALVRESSAACRFIDLEDREVATLQELNDDRLLTFSEALERDPFAKMVILGKALLV